jgi:hypothetical protein
MRHERPPPRGVVEESSTAPPPAPIGNLHCPLGDRPSHRSTSCCRASTCGGTDEAVAELDPRLAAEKEAWP